MSHVLIAFFQCLSAICATSELKSFLMRSGSESGGFAVAAFFFDFAGPPFAGTLAFEGGGMMRNKDEAY